MEVTRAKLKLKMNPFRKRDSIPICGGGEGTVARPSTSSCSCPCSQQIVTLKKQVDALSSQMARYANVIREFQEIRAEIFGEAGHEEDPIQPHTLFKNEQGISREEKEEEACPDFGNTLSLNEEEQNDMEIECGNESEDFAGCVIVKSVSLAAAATTPVITPPLATGISFPSVQLIQSNEQTSTFTQNVGDTQSVLDINGNDQPTRRKRQRKGATEPAPDSATALLPKDCPLVCQECKTGRVFKERGSLRRHILHFHAEHRKTFVCVPCHRTFQYKEGLTYHTKSVHQGIRYICGVEECTAGYSTITALRKHQRVNGHAGDGQTLRIQDWSSNSTDKRDT